MTGKRTVFKEPPFLKKWEGLWDRVTGQRLQPEGSWGGVLYGDVLLGLYSCDARYAERALDPSFLPGIALSQPHLHEQRLLEPSTPCSEVLIRWKPCSHGFRAPFPASVKLDDQTLGAEEGGKRGGG